MTRDLTGFEWLGFLHSCTGSGTHWPPHKKEPELELETATISKVSPCMAMQQHLQFSYATNHGNIRKLAKAAENRIAHIAHLFSVALDAQNDYDDSKTICCSHDPSSMLQPLWQISPEPVDVEQMPNKGGEFQSQGKTRQNISSWVTTAPHHGHHPNNRKKILGH